MRTGCNRTAPGFLLPVRLYHCEVRVLFCEVLEPRFEFLLVEGFELLGFQRIQILSEVTPRVLEPLGAHELRSNFVDARVLFAHHGFLLRFLELGFELSNALVLALNLLLSTLLGSEARALTRLLLALQLFVLSFLLLALALELRDLVRVVGTVVLFEPLLSLTLQPSLERFPL